MALLRSETSGANPGLSDRILWDLHELFSRFPEVETVLIYGSRAKGTFQRGSDIDLAVMSKTLSEKRYTQLWSEVEGLPIAFGIDLLHWDQLGNPALKERILSEGNALYPDITQGAARRVLDSMEFGSLRDLVYRRFHDQLDRRFFEFITKDPARHGAYYTAMYLLQDTYESTFTVARLGLSKDPFRQYLEVWGYLQATFIAQDSITELFNAVTGEKPDTGGCPFWEQIGNCRNEIAGHPLDRQGRYRSFFGRFEQSLENFTYERLDSDTGKIEHPQVNLESLRNDFFEQDGATILRKIIEHIDTAIRR